MVLEVLPGQSGRRRKKRGLKTGEEGVQLLPLANEVIFYFEDPKSSTRKFLELINKFSQITGYKVNLKN